MCVVSRSRRRGLWGLCYIMLYLNGVLGVVYGCYGCGLRVLWVWLCNIRVYFMYIMGDGIVGVVYGCFRCD